MYKYNMAGINFLRKINTQILYNEYNQNIIGFISMFGKNKDKTMKKNT